MVLLCAAKPKRAVIQTIYLQKTKTVFYNILPLFLWGSQPRSQTLTRILQLILISCQPHHHLNAKIPFQLKKKQPHMNKSQGFHVTGSKKDKQNTQTQRNQILLSSEQFLTDLNCLNLCLKLVHTISSSDLLRKFPYSYSWKNASHGQWRKTHFAHSIFHNICIRLLM